MSWELFLCTERATWHLPPQQWGWGNIFWKQWQWPKKHLRRIKWLLWKRIGERRGPRNMQGPTSWSLSLWRRNLELQNTLLPVVATVNLTPEILNIKTFKSNSLGITLSWRLPKPIVRSIISWTFCIFRLTVMSLLHIQHRSGGSIARKACSSTGRNRASLPFWIGS